MKKKKWFCIHEYFVQNRFYIVSIKKCYRLFWCFSAIDLVCFVDSKMRWIPYTVFCYIYTAVVSSKIDGCLVTLTDDVRFRPENFFFSHIFHVQTKNSRLLLIQSNVKMAIYSNDSINSDIWQHLTLVVLWQTLCVQSNYNDSQPTINEWFLI